MLRLNSDDRALPCKAGRVTASKRPWCFGLAVMQVLLESFTAPMRQALQAVSARTRLPLQSSTAQLILRGDSLLGRLWSIAVHFEIVNLVGPRDTFLGTESGNSQGTRSASA